MLFFHMEFIRSLVGFTKRKTPCQEQTSKGCCSESGKAIRIPLFFVRIHPNNRAKPHYD